MLMFFYFELGFVKRIITVGSLSAKTMMLTIETYRIDRTLVSTLSFQFNFLAE